ncbi:MAG: hypothetical protein Q9227_006721 [Pyrenula ochraceoflavens]
MDPLSITTATLAFAATISASVKRLKALRDAPKEIQRLENDLRDIKLILRVFEQAFANTRSEVLYQEQDDSSERQIFNQEQVNDASKLLSRARNILQELSHILQDRLRTSSSKNPQSRQDDSTPDLESEHPRLVRTKWLRWRSKVEALRKELLEVRLSLSAVIEAKTLLEVKSVLLRLDGLVLFEHRTSGGAQTQPQLQAHSAQNADVTWDQLTGPSSEPDVHELTERTLSSQSRDPSLPASSSTRSIEPSIAPDVLLKFCEFARCPPFCSCEPQMQLKTLRTIPASSDVFRFAGVGDVRRIQTLFSDGKASIYDVDDWGWSALHKAYRLGQSTVCSFLIKAGADVSLVGDNTISVVERAWFYDRTRTGSPGSLAVTYTHIFSNLDYEEFATSQQYTVLHKIVLSITPDLGLESQLRASTALIDAPDKNGRTPLWWACARGDAVAARVLLRYGASINPNPGNYDRPLHVAHTPEVFKLLLEFGADIESRNKAGRTALHTCCYHGPERRGDLALLKTILEAGADVNAKSASGNTPLHFAALYGMTAHIEELLKKGADIEAERFVKHDTRHSSAAFWSLPRQLDDDINPLIGMTPLLSAVHHSQTISITVLLKHGANPTRVTYHGLNIIHVAAMRSNAATFEMLAGANLKDVNPELQDASAFRPRDYLLKRVDFTVDLLDAFERLASSTVAENSDTQASASAFEDSESEENFQDALENI